MVVCVRINLCILVISHGCSVPFSVRAFYFCVYACQLGPIFSETKGGDPMWIRLCIGLAVSRIHEVVITTDVGAAVQEVMPDGVQFVVAGGRLQLKCDGKREGK